MKRLKITDGCLELLKHECSPETKSPILKSESESNSPASKVGSPGETPQKSEKEDGENVITSIQESDSVKLPIYGDS